MLHVCCSEACYTVCIQLHIHILYVQCIYMHVYTYVQYTHIQFIPLCRDPGDIAEALSGMWQSQLLPELLQPHAVPCIYVASLRR